MALIKCPGCGNDVSTDSFECLKCGELNHYQAPVVNERSRLKKDTISYLIAIAILSTISIVFAIVGTIITESRIFYFSFPNFLILVYSIKLLIGWKNDD